jgi:putative SOS response-associated peptidase YedK
MEYAMPRKSYSCSNIQIFSKFNSLNKHNAMCYANALRKSEKQLPELLNPKLKGKLSKPSSYQPTYHLNAFTNGLLYIITMDEPAHIRPAHWGLVPHWATKDPEGFWAKSANTLNARSETLFEKASFEPSAREKRCLILSDGFFEPQHVNNIAKPYFCYQPRSTFPEGDLFCFAGLYSELDNDTFSTTIITTEANPFFAEIHNKKKRMPLVLAESLYSSWLDSRLNQADVKELMFEGFTTKNFTAHEVSRDLYRKNIDTNKPYIIEAVEKDTLF